MPDALSRTVLLIRDYIKAEADDARILETLASTTIVLAANRENLKTAEGLQCLLTTLLLVARSGARLFVDAPNAPLVCHAPPFRGAWLLDAILDISIDLLPQTAVDVGLPDGKADLAILLGDTRWKGNAKRVIRLSGEEWTGRVTRDPMGSWRCTGSPFGALTAAALGAGEAFKAAIMRLRHFATNKGAFDELFAPIYAAEVSLAPAGSPVPKGKLGSIDIISGGAITHALLYALARLPSGVAVGRVIDVERNDITNLNRYMLQRRSDCGYLKSDHLASLDLGAIRLTSCPVRYDEESRSQIGNLAPITLVGVDHIPTRWLVQEARPQWLGIGATSHFSSMASQHEAGLGCARCLHPYDDEPDGGLIPTCAFVSFWAGLWLASLAVRHADGGNVEKNSQVVYTTALRADAKHSILRFPVSPRSNCSLRCPL